MTITETLIKSPPKIAFHIAMANKFYKQLLRYKEDYKRAYAKKYLEWRAREGTVKIKDIEANLVVDTDLTTIKDSELLAEINYKGERQKAQAWSDYFQAAITMGYLKRQELKSLHDTVKEVT